MHRVILSLLAVVLAAVLPAQDDSSSKISLKKATIAGDKLALTLAVDAGYHFYSVKGEELNRTQIKLDDGPRAISGEVSEPKPKHHRKEYDGGYVEEYDFHEGEVTFTATLTPTGKPGSVIKGKVEIVCCDDSSCMPPGAVPFEVKIPGAAAESKAVQAPAGGAPETARAPADDLVEIKDPPRLGKFDAKDPFQVVRIAHPKSVVAGTPFTMTVEVKIAPPYHIYGLTQVGEFETPTSFWVKAAGKQPSLLEVKGDPKADHPAKHRQTEYEKFDYWSPAVKFDVPVVANGSAGKRAGVLKVTYQTCTFEGCLAPTNAEYDFTVDVTGGTAAPPDEGTPATDPPPTKKPDVPPTAVEPAPVTRRSTPPATALGTAAFDTPEIRAGKTVTLVIRNLGLRDMPSEMPAVTLIEAPGLAIDGPAMAQLVGGELVIRQPLTLALDAKDGNYLLRGEVSVGTQKVMFTGGFKVSTSIWAFILIAALAAAASLLTPCVFPMIPITVSYFTKQAESVHHRPVFLGAAYCFGIIASFTAIGTLFTLALGGDGANAFAQSWITQLLIGLLFIFFALSLFGMFELQLPAGLMNLVGSAQGKGGVGGVLLMGLLFSVTTFTCTAPFVGGLLAGAAASKDWTRPLVGMVAFSAVLAIPFFFLSVFPSYLKRLPRAGGWLNETKVVMGFVECAAAIKFISTADLTLGWGIFTRNACIASWIALFALAAVYLIGLIRLPHDSAKERVGVGSMMLSAVFLTTSIYLTTGLGGQPLGSFFDGWLPPVEEDLNPVLRDNRLVRSVVEAVRQSGVGGATADAGPPGRVGVGGHFKEDYAAARAEAIRLGLPLLLDFTGFTCTNCRAVEGAVFNNTRADVQRALNQFVMVELHLDGEPNKIDPAIREANNAMVLRYTGTYGMPQYVILDPRTERVITRWAFENADVKRWVPLLDDAARRFRAS